MMSQAKLLTYKTNQRLLAEKKAGGCEDCGFKAHPAALDLDHIDYRTKYVTKTGKKQNPSSMVTYNTATFIAELAKCRVLCKNCHAIHTFEQSKQRRSNGENLNRGVGRVPKMSESPVRLVA